MSELLQKVLTDTAARQPGAAKRIALASPTEAFAYWSS